MKLTKEEKRIQEKFATDFATNGDEFIAEYRAKFDNYLCSDNALELSRNYQNATKEQKARYAEILRDTASAIIRAAFDKMLGEQPEQEKENMVLFVAGGSGAGKTSVITGVQSIESLKKGCHIVYEVVLGLTEEKIQKVFDAEKWVGILYVHRPVEYAAAGALLRAEQEGRLPSFEYVYEGHIGCQRQFIALCEKFETHPTFSYVIGDNSKENVHPELILTSDSLELIRTNAYKDIREVEEKALKGVQDVIRKREEQSQPFNESLVRRYIGNRATENETEIYRNRTERDQQLERRDRQGDRTTEEGRYIREPGKLPSESGQNQEGQEELGEQQTEYSVPERYAYNVSFPTGEKFLFELSKPLKPGQSVNELLRQSGISPKELLNLEKGQMIEVHLQHPRDSDDSEEAIQLNQQTRERQR